MKTIGKYIIRGQLGRGGMGAVYKVEMPVTGKIVALKLLKPDPMLIRLMGEEPIRELFISEAVIMGGLRHPHIVEIRDVEAAGEHPWYIMDYYCGNLGNMMGETYETEKPSRRLPVDSALRFIRQTLEGLACLHWAGIVHRDIKPFNLLVTENGTVKICDFGLSLLRGERFKGPPSLKVGTPWYASPEQESRPDDVDFNTDLFPVGVTLYRMLTGRLPRRHPQDRPEPLSRCHPDLDADWDDFVFRAMHTEPGRRYGSARAMLEDLLVLEKAWAVKRENICRLDASDGGGEGRMDAPENPPRSEPVKVRSRTARERFGLDVLWRPEPYFRNRFRPENETVVIDASAGLAWQRSGSEYPVTWRQANEYAAELNRIRFAGRKDWRLPTVDELIRLLTPPPLGRDLCIEPLFDARQKWLWSCDRCTYISAWYASLELGFVSWQDFDGRYYARAVSRQLRPS